MKRRSLLAGAAAALVATPAAAVCSLPQEPPATQAERDALQWPALEIDFDAAKRTWERNWRPVAMALCTMQKSSDELVHVTRMMVNGGLAAPMLEDLVAGRDWLLDMAGLMDKALMRSQLCLERLGYAPDNPPPGFGDEA